MKLSNERFEIEIISKSEFVDDYSAENKNFLVTIWNIHISMEALLNWVTSEIPTESDEPFFGSHEEYEAEVNRCVSEREEFKEKIEEGGFILAHWDGTTETEEKIKEETKATIRCIPFDSFVPGDKEPGKCMVTGKPSACRVIFARSY